MEWLWHYLSEAMSWRVHLESTKGGIKWRYCQDAECPNDHHLYEPFHGVGPVTHKWDGVKHSKH